MILSILIILITIYFCRAQKHASYFAEAIGKQLLFYFKCNEIRDGHKGLRDWGEEEQKVSYKQQTYTQFRHLHIFFIKQYLLW